MKKITLFLVGIALLMTTSCSTTASGAWNGAWIGGAIGSAIGGITGGHRGSDIGHLMGMAIGAGTGAAVGAANEASVKENIAARTQTRHNDSDYAYVDNALVEIDNARFINDNNTLQIKGGETAQITFEVHNATGEVLKNIVIGVNETTGNKRLLVSQPILVEHIRPHGALRYTANISAYKNLKDGTANFQLYVKEKNKLMCEPIEFEVELQK